MAIQEAGQGQQPIDNSGRRRLSRRQLLIGGGGLAAAGALTAVGVGLAEGGADKSRGAVIPSVASDGNGDGAGQQAPAGETATGEATSNPTAAETPTPTEVLEPTTLRGWADKAGLKMGASLGHSEVSGMFPLLAKEFNGASVSYDLAWNNLEVDRGTLQFRNSSKFADSDSKVQFATTNKMSITGQSLLFAAEYPDWLKKGNFTTDEATALVAGHVRDVVSHFKGDVTNWIVGNEFHPLSWGRDDVLQRVVGPEILDTAFQIARTADPSATLIYNDNANHATQSGSVLDSGAYANTKAIVDRLKAKGLIDAVGVQMHVDGSNVPTPEDIEATLKSYGIPVFITEMDVNMKNVQGSQDERFAKQAEIYRSILEAALKTGVCKNITFYTVGDKYSWIETDKTYGQYSPQADPTPFDDNLQPKPAYNAIVDVVKAAV